MAKAPVIVRKQYNECPPLKEELRKVLFPNVPPPTMKQLKERKNKGNAHKKR